MFAKIHEAGPPVEAQPQPLAQQLAPVTRNGGGWIFLSFPLLAIVCHLIYSPLGFNPTDDGLQLAFARRVLHGEIPHRDFISVRPALSYYAWAPAVALFGDRVLLLSRGIVWLQWAAITAAWTWLFARALPKNHLQSAEITAAGIIAFATSVHHFPIMPWHTTDGLMLASLGLMLTCSSRPVRRSLGWFIIGLAPLCKQSFVPLVPLLLLLSLDRKRWQAWMLATAPTFFYACALVMAGAGKDAWDQLTANRGFLPTAFFSYPVAYPPFFGIAGLAAAWVATRERLCSAPYYRLLSVLAAVGLGILPPAGFYLFAAPELASLHLFAAVLGLALGLTISDLFPSLRPFKKADALSPNISAFVWQSTILAWCTAISVAVNYPSLSAGLLWLAAFGVFASDWEKLIRRPWQRVAVCGVVALLMVPCFHYLRTHRIYREATASELTEDLGSVLSGGKGIFTNRQLMSMFSELSTLAKGDSRQPRPYAILPDCSAWWIRAPQHNPLPVTWDNEVELPDEGLRQRAISAMESQRGKLVVFVTRYETDSLAKDRISLLPRYPLTQYVRSHWQKTGETEYFLIYE